MNIIRRAHFSAVIMVIMLLLTGIVGIPKSYAQQDEQKPYSGIVITPDKARPFNLAAKIMEIHPGKNARIVVAEKTILISEYKFNDQVQSTQLIGSSDQAITLKDLKVGQLVIVKGLKLTDGTMIGESIKVKPKKK